jgi:hypothetical protein
MTEKINWKLVSIVAVTALIAFLLIDNNNKSNKIEELKRTIEENEDLTLELKQKLNELIEKNKSIDPSVASELSQILALLEIKQDTTAVLKLAKIIETLLKKLYNKDEKLIELAKSYGRKTPSFSDYLEHCKNEKILTQEDFHLLSVLKIVRNEEAHEIDIRKEKSKLISSLICGVGLILGLTKIINKSITE